MRALLNAAGALALVVACNVSSIDPPPTPPTAIPTAPAAVPTVTAAAVPTRVAAATQNAAPTPINVDDMMGGFPPQTVFVATNDRVSAVTLLNHHTRYRIETNGPAQLTANMRDQRLYLVDGDPNATGSHRLRAFDFAEGKERAAIGGMSNLVTTGHALAIATDGRVLVLKSDARRTWVDAYNPLTLHAVGVMLDTPGCGDRLLSGRSRVAVVCLGTGAIASVNVFGTPASIEGAPPNLTAAVMADDGALLLLSAEPRLMTLAAGATRISTSVWPMDWSGAVLPDTLAVAQAADVALFAQRTESTTWLRVFSPHNAVQRQSFRLDGVPHGRIVALWPFAYFAVDRSIRHVDLTSGLLETMADVGPGAVPGVVVNG
jgi:hypothetical protein